MLRAVVEFTVEYHDMLGAPAIRSSKGDTSVVSRGNTVREGTEVAVTTALNAEASATVAVTLTAFIPAALDVSDGNVTIGLNGSDEFTDETKTFFECREEDALQLEPVLIVSVTSRAGAVLDD